MISRRVLTAGWYRIYVPVLFLSAIFCFTSGIAAQAGKTGAGASAFEMMEKAFQHIQYPDGFNKLQLTITTKDGKTVIYKVTQSQKSGNTLFIFDSISRGNILKLLYNNNGQNTFAYFIHDKRLFHKKYMDRFDRVLDSGFTFFDLNNSPFLENYTQRISGSEKAGSSARVVVENIPLDKGSYGKVIAVVDPQNDNRLVRMDYYDTAMTLMKSMNITYAKMPFKEAKNNTIQKEYAVKWDMADMNRGTVSTLEFFISDKTARLDPSLFRKENLEK